MRKTRIFYDIFSIILVLVIVFSFISKSTVYKDVLVIMIVLIALTIAYTISIIVLAINLATKAEKELPSLIIIIIGCLIIPVVGPILFYIFVLRKITKSVGEN
jgi:hypothetical protein